MTETFNLHVYVCANKTSHHKIASWQITLNWWSCVFSKYSNRILHSRCIICVLRLNPHSYWIYQTIVGTDIFWFKHELHDLNFLFRCRFSSCYSFSFRSFSCYSYPSRSLPKSPSLVKRPFSFTKRTTIISSFFILVGILSSDICNLSVVMKFLFFLFYLAYRIDNANI